MCKHFNWWQTGSACHLFLALSSGCSRHSTESSIIYSYKIKWAILKPVFCPSQHILQFLLSLKSKFLFVSLWSVYWFIISVFCTTVYVKGFWLVYNYFFLFLWSPSEACSLNSPFLFCWLYFVILYNKHTFPGCRCPFQPFSFHWITELSKPWGFLIV